MMSKELLDERKQNHKVTEFVTVGEIAIMTIITKVIGIPCMSLGIMV
jgi:hypothetical protein